MSGAELSLAIVGTIDLCFKYGNRLATMCADFRNARADITERIVRIESIWQRTRVQIAFVQRVWNGLSPEYQATQDEILQILNGKLTIAVSKIEAVMIDPAQVTSSGNSSQLYRLPVRRLKYVLLKERLDKAIEDLENWQKIFDPSWFLILMTSSPLVDAELDATTESSVSSTVSSVRKLRDALQDNPTSKEAIFLPEDGLSSAQISTIPLSSARIAQRAGSTQLLVLDTIFCSEQDVIPQVIAKVRDLARKLSQADPLRFGLLNCRGVVRSSVSRTKQLPSFTFVFKTLEGHLRPQSLRTCLAAGAENHSLSDRLVIAKELAKSVSFVHTFGFVHKSIRPENVLITTQNASRLGHCFLVGFQDFRAADGHTLRSGDDLWSRNLYRHPARQGLRPDEYYIMQHDIYSLGCCLLEIGMWESLVYYGEDGRPLPTTLLSTATDKLSNWNSVIVKEYLISLAQSALPKRMGDRYAKVVETCLTCLDEQNADFGDESEFQDEDGVLVGVRFIEKVLLQLDSISI